MIFPYCILRASGSQVFISLQKLQMQLDCCVDSLVKEFVLHDPLSPICTFDSPSKSKVRILTT